MKSPPRHRDIPSTLVPHPFPLTKPPGLMSDKTEPGSQTAEIITLRNSPAQKKRFRHFSWHHHYHHCWENLFSLFRFKFHSVCDHRFHKRSDPFNFPSLINLGLVWMGRDQFHMSLLSISRGPFSHWCTPWVASPMFLPCSFFFFFAVSTKQQHEARFCGNKKCSA